MAADASLQPVSSLSEGRVGEVMVPDVNMNPAPVVGSKPSQTKFIMNIDSDEIILRRFKSKGNHSLTVLFSDSVDLLEYFPGDYKLNWMGFGADLFDALRKGHVAKRESELAARSLANLSSERVQLPFISNEKSVSENKSIDFNRRNSKVGVDYALPNMMNVVGIVLEGLSEAQLIELLGKLRGTGLLAGLSLDTAPEPQTSNYQPTPTDPYFPTGGSGWQYRDWNSDKYLPGGINKAETWWLNRHAFPAAWQMSTGVGVTVAVLDTGFQLDNTSDGITWDKVNAWDVTTNSNPSDAGYLPPPGDQKPYHGSLIAALIGAKPNNGNMLCGVAPDCKILPVRFDYTNANAHAAAINKAVAKGAKIINYSFGDQNNPIETNSVIRAAAVTAEAANALIVASAGNADAQLTFNPVYETKHLIVGAEHKWHIPPPGYTWGPRVDMIAAGVDITVESIKSLAPYDWRVETQSGSSFAAPMVAGAAALLRKYESNSNKIRDVLIGTCNWAPSYGGRYSCSTYGYGSDGLPKTRSLDAFGATLVMSQYNPTWPHQLYRPVSADRGYVSQGSWYTYSNPYPGGNAPYPTGNMMIGFAGLGGINVWTENYAAPDPYWAGSATLFSNKSFYSQMVIGVPRYTTAEGVSVIGGQNIATDGTTTGWRFMGTL